MSKYTSPVSSGKSPRRFLSGEGGKKIYEFSPGRPAGRDKGLILTQVRLDGYQGFAAEASEMHLKGVLIIYPKNK